MNGTRTFYNISPAHGGRTRKIYFILFSVQFSYENSTYIFQRFVAKKADRIFSDYSRKFIPAFAAEENLKTYYLEYVRYG